MALQQYGSQCLSLVTQATQCLNTGHPEEAKKYLAIAKQTTPQLLKVLENNRAEVASKRDELDEKDKSLKREIGAKEAAKSKLREEIQTLQQRKARNEALLWDARRSLDEAESQRRSAESRKDDAIAGTVAGGVGAAVLGVIFPPSLFVTVPAVATAGTVSIVEADKAVDRCRDKVRSVERDIDSEKQRIRNAESDISGVESEINSLNSKEKALYKELGSVREAFVFLQQAVTFFSEIHVAVEAGGGKTDLLYKIVEKASERKQYRILNSRGGITVANSFADVWKHVESKLADGNQNGFLGITVLDSISN